MSKKASALVFALWLGLWVALALLWRDPISRTSLRCGILLSMLAIWGVGLLLGWQHRLLRGALIAAPVLLALTLACDGPAYDRAALRDDYLKCLLSYEGSPYVWGGEARGAIDCSGLVEKALIDASWRRGLATGRPRLVRSAIELWWHRASADALRDEYHGLTRRVLQTEYLANVDGSRLVPGDLMVPLNGEHTMAYLGNQTWIEADPSAGVIRVKSPDSFWFKHPAIVLRWRELE